MPRFNLWFAVTAVAVAATTPAFAQTAAPAAPAPATSATATPAAQITVGAKVMGPGGADVGTISSVGPDYAVVKTDRHEVNLPKEAFGPRPDGLVIGLSRDDLNATVDQAMAKLAQLLQAGSAVYGTGGNQLGTIDAVENDLVTLKLASGKLVRLPKAGFAPGPNGLMIGFTSEQLEAQAAAAG